MRRRKERASKFGLKSSASIASRTRSAVTGSTATEPVTKRDTVEIETPARVATSWIVVSRSSRILAEVDRLRVVTCHQTKGPGWHRDRHLLAPRSQHSLTRPQ